MKQFSIYSKFLLVIVLFTSQSLKAQYILSKLEWKSDFDRQVEHYSATSPISIVSDSSVAVNPRSSHQAMACTAPGNDNFPGTALVVNAPVTAGTTCGATLQAGENTGCNAILGAGAQFTVWYQFTATSTTLYVNLLNTLESGTGNPGDFLGIAIWGTPIGSYPVAADCNPIECNFQQMAPNDAKIVCPGNCQIGTSIELTNGQITVGNTYYIQITDQSQTDASTFDISVSTSFPGGSYVLTNPGLSNITFASPTSTCFLTTTAPSPTTNSPPCAAENITDPPYPDITADYKHNNALGCSAASCNNCVALGVTIPAGYVYTNCITATNPTKGAGNGFGSVTANWSYVYYSDACVSTSAANFNGQASQSCSSGNALWLDWTMYTTGGTPVACGNGSFTAASTNVSGLGCTESYVICFQFESGCDMTTSTGSNTSGPGIYPYMSWESTGQSPCSTNALPISLLNFQVNYDQPSNDVTIYWATSSQVNNRLFTIEKSVDGVNFQTVKEVAGAGNSTDILYYSVDDENPWAGLSYYRLKQTDYDGTETYSQLDPLDIPADYSANIYPNPTSGNMTLRYSSQSPDPVNVRISDISGSLVASYTISDITKGMNTYPVYTENLGSGMYIMQVSNYKKTFFLKFIKQ